MLFHTKGFIMKTFKVRDTILWYDYETFGTDTRRDRAAQFAAIRTDMNLNVIDDPINIYCKLSPDYLPSPEACLITGLTPQKVNQLGVPEAEFIRLILEEMRHPNTISAGYNSIRFDSEITRNLCYKNLRNPYNHEWEAGTSRWDLIDVVRAVHAIRPDGIQWPVNDKGVTSFRLEDLTAANNLVHEDAHNALSDVYATIAVAKMIKEKKSVMFDWILKHRTKDQFGDILKINEPVLHVSPFYGAENGNISLVVPLCAQKGDKNGLVFYDLRKDPQPIIDKFLANESISDEKGFFSIQKNRCPVFSPSGTLSQGEPREKWNLNYRQAKIYLDKLLANPLLIQQFHELSERKYDNSETNPDLMIYSGGFFSRNDALSMQNAVNLSPDKLNTTQFNFDDLRLPEMLFRYQARNFPETLSQEQVERWNEFCEQQLSEQRAPFNQSIEELKKETAQPEKIAILDALQAYEAELSTSFNDRKTQVVEQSGLHI